MRSVYEWLPTAIVAGTFLVGLLAESLEADRFDRLQARLAG